MPKAIEAEGDIEIAKLHAKIEQLVAEREFLSKGFARCASRGGDR
ncbi:MAG: transposase [Sphingomonas echinoides]|jgi:transposase